MATKVEIPQTAESVSEVTIVEWLKKDGDWVEQDENICVLETDKADVELPSPVSGILKIERQAGDTVPVGNTIGTIDENAEKGQSSKSTDVKQKDTNNKEKQAKQPEDTRQSAQPQDTTQQKRQQSSDEFSPAVRRLIQEQDLDPSKISPTGKGGRLTKEDVLAYIEKQEQEEAQSKPKTQQEEQKTKESPKPAVAIRGEGQNKLAYALDDSPELDEAIKRVPMSKIRRRIADNLVKSQQTAAMLTTFNEVDMSAVMNLREKYRERFDQVHGVKLGFMSFFAKAVCMALEEFPSLNASIDGNDVVYHQHVDLGIAVSTDRGLVVPVIRGASQMPLAKIELEIKRLAQNARAGRLGIKELTGGTFTITNGGIFGSLLSTPILNLPQSGILGMHAIQKRPVAVGDKIEIRPMMYTALTYDHRIVDGSVSVSFLVRIKESLEDPARMVLDI